MSAVHPMPLAASAKNLRRLFWLRNATIAFLSAVTLLLLRLGIPLHIAPIATSLGGMALLNLITLLRLRQPETLGEKELLLQLLGDIAILTLLFYFTGGYSNPFVWMYLLPLSIAAVALRSRHIWLVAMLAVLCYSGLVFFHVPLSHLHLHTMDGTGPDIHLVGMWLGFVVSAGMIAIFVARIGQNLREYDHLIATAREQALESERMLALGALATAAAHELGTPLATMAVLTGEMGQEHAGKPELMSNIALLKTQIVRCKEILSSLTASAGQARGEATRSVALDDFLAEVLQRWRDMRPAIRFESRLQGATPAPHIAADRTLGQALTNLLDNAADASPQQVEMQGGWDNSTLHLEIRDHGAGLTPETAARAGTPFFTTKPDDGLGIGLYLARTILGRFGGSVKLQNHPRGGVITSVHLPLAGLLTGNNT